MATAKPETYSRIGCVRWASVVALTIALAHVAACAHVVEKPTGAIVQMHASADIAVPIESVFAFAANATNDAQWRDEVVSISGPRTMRIGGRYTERASIAQAGNHVAVLRIDALNPPMSVRYAAPSGAARHLTVERDFAAIGPSETRFTYRVTADLELVADLAGSAVPVVLAASAYQTRMRRYQRHLKMLLEDGG